TAATLAGVGRLGLSRWHSGDGPAAVYAALSATYRRILRHEPSLTSLHVDHFLMLVARMRGRDLWSGAEQADPLVTLIRQERGRCPLRQRLKERGRQLADARAHFEAGLRANDVVAIAAALEVADAASSRRAAIPWDDHAALLPALARLWDADEPLAVLEAFERESPAPVG